MDATHFRQRAAHAREIAQSGDDIRLSRMLLEVAIELEAEAEAMETDSANNRDKVLQARKSPVHGPVLLQPGPANKAWPVQT